MGWSCREEWDMEIRRLNQKDYAGRKFTARYQTNGYYEICASEQGFRLDYRLFPAPVGRSFDDVFFGEWLEAPAAFGAFDSDSQKGLSRAGTTGSGSATSASLTAPRAAKGPAVC